MFSKFQTRVQSVKTHASRAVDTIVDGVESASSHAADAASAALGDMDPKWKRRILGGTAIAGVTYVAPMAIPVIGALTVAQWAIRGEIVHQASKKSQ